MSNETPDRRPQWYDFPFTRPRGMSKQTFEAIIPHVSKARRSPGEIVKYSDEGKTWYGVRP